VRRKGGGEGGKWLFASPSNAELKASDATGVTEGRKRAERRKVEERIALLA